MKIAALIARMLLGLMFFVFGLNGFLNFIPAPPLSGLPAQFLNALVTSHYIYLIAAAETVAGALLLANLYVVFALTMLAAVLANILTYHATIMADGWPVALVTALLWFAVAWPLRAHFAPLFVRKV